MRKNNLLLNKVLRFIENNQLKNKWDQNFLIDHQVINDLINSANLKKSETILEIGTGLGFLTVTAAKKVNQLITIEIDTRFKPFLNFLPKNVKLIFGDVYRLFCDKDFIFNLKSLKIDKIIGNFPYSKIENLLHPLMKSSWFKGDIFMIGPISFINKVNQNPIFGSYFQANFVKKIKKSSFYPEPKTISAIIYLKRINDPEKTNDQKIFIRRFLYQHESWKLKNGLREGIISFGEKIRHQKITKNQARKIIKKLNIPQSVLEKTIYQIKPDLYFFISEKLTEKLTEEI